MRRGHERADGAEPPESETAVEVACPDRGVYVFYTGREGEYIRTDVVVDPDNHW